MRKIIVILIPLIILGAVLFYQKMHNSEEMDSQPVAPVSEISNVIESKKVIEKESSLFQAPLERASERVTRKSFGILITPQTSPVQPEKFSGYHAGTDFEIFPEELELDVSVHAVCSGKLRVKKYVNGYGGVVVQNCLLDNENVTVLYGHLRLASVIFEVGDEIGTGDSIGILGAAFSQETSGERKHLHLGLHKGTEIVFWGYVQNENDLSAWMDPCQYVCK